MNGFCSRAPAIPPRLATIASPVNSLTPCSTLPAIARSARVDFSLRALTTSDLPLKWGVRSEESCSSRSSWRSL